MWILSGLEDEVNLLIAAVSVSRAVARLGLVAHLRQHLRHAARRRGRRVVAYVLLGGAIGQVERVLLLLLRGGRISARPAGSRSTSWGWS